MTAGFLMIPHLSIATEVEGLKDLPAIVFQFRYTSNYACDERLVFSLLLGLAATWTKRR